MSEILSLQHCNLLAKARLRDRLDLVKKLIDNNLDNNADYMVLLNQSILTLQGDFVDSFRYYREEFKKKKNENNNPTKKA